MEEIISIKEELDKIDNGMMNAVVDGFYNSRLKILIGMWEKGKIIGQFTGVNCPNFYELEKLTERSHHSLSKWYDLYKNNIEKRKYIEKVAKPKALSWAQKALQPKTLSLEENNKRPKDNVDLLETMANSLENIINQYSDKEVCFEFIPLIKKIINDIKTKKTTS